MMQATRRTLSGRNYLHTWEGLASGDTSGDAVSIPGAADRSVQVIGTFGGATVLIEGSNDGVNFASLKDAQGDALSFTAAGLELILENVVHIRPRVTGESGTTDLDVLLLSRSTMR